MAITPPKDSPAFNGARQSADTMLTEKLDLFKVSLVLTSLYHQIKYLNPRFKCCVSQYHIFPSIC